MKNKESAATRRARRRALQEERAQRGGTTGRVRPDQRRPSGVAVDLRIPIDEIRDDGLEVVERLPAAWMTELLREPRDEPWQAAEEGHIELLLTRDPSTVHLKGRGRFTLHHTCVRCLGRVDFDVDLDLDLRLIARENVVDPLREPVHMDLGETAEMPDEGEKLDEEDADLVRFDGRTIDLASILKEQLFLELPIHPTHESEGARGGEACEIDPSGALKAEQERWADPRWAALCALKDRLGSGGSN